MQPDGGSGMALIDYDVGKDFSNEQYSSTNSEVSGGSRTWEAWKGLKTNRTRPKVFIQVSRCS